MYTYKINKASKKFGICFAIGMGMMFVPAESEWLSPILGMKAASAQGCCGGGVHAEPGESDPDHDEPTVSISGNLTDEATDTIVAELESIVAECSGLPAEYQADCLAQNLQEASTVVNNAGYSEVNTKIRSAGNRISREVSRNIDRSKPTIKRNGKTYRAVKKSAVAKVNKVAAKVVTDTASSLIRSAGNSAVKKIHYARIAKAVDNTKVLLRSA